MLRRTLSLAIITLALGAGCTAKATSDPAVLRAVITSSTTPLMDDVLRAYHSVAPDVSFELEYGSAQTVQLALTNGSSDWGLLTYLQSDSGLWSSPIGTDALAIVVSTQNATLGLTLGQLRSIYQGRSTNWQEFGGPDMPITVISREPGSGARGLFDDVAMSNTPTLPTARLATSNNGVLNLILQEPAAIGYISLAALEGPVRTLPINDVAPSQDAARDGRYLLTNIIRFVANDEPQGPARDLLSWMLSDEGQAIVAQQYAPLVR